MSYWAKADKQMKALLAYLNQYDLTNKIQPIVDHYSKLNPDGLLTVKQISQLKGNLSRRKKVKNREAMIYYISAELSLMYNAIAKKAIEIYKEISPETNIADFLKNANPIYGGTFTSDLTTEMNYRTIQIVKAVEQSYYQKVAFDFLDDTLKKFLLRATKTQYAGLLDRYMTTVMGYANIVALKRRGFEKVKFKAVLDESTTGVCKKLNGRIFNVDNLIIGVNAPPIVRGLDGENLPHECRSWLEGIK